MSERIGVDFPMFASSGGNMIKKGETEGATTDSGNPKKRGRCLPELDMGEESREQGFRLNGCR